MSLNSSIVNIFYQATPGESDVMIPYSPPGHGSRLYELELLPMRDCREGIGGSGLSDGAYDLPAAENAGTAGGGLGVMDGACRIGLTDDMSSGYGREMALCGTRFLFLLVKMLFLDSGLRL